MLHKKGRNYSFIVFYVEEKQKSKEKESQRQNFMRSYEDA
jgi:hypothetical protein